tara:strand:- start:102 stop:224 length:123 start_codon:yes stop_codon:yes gene_type:complete
MNVINWLKSPQGQDARLVLEVTTSVLVFFWLLKNHKIIQK